MTKQPGRLLLVLFFALAASPVAISQGNDVDGIVTRASSSDPIVGVLVTLSSGPPDPLSARALQIASRQAGINFSPSSQEDEELMLHSLNSAALGTGVSPGNANLVTALRDYRERTAKFKAVTGRDGRFTIRNVPSGPYTVRAERDGFIGMQNAVTTIAVPGARSPVTLSLIPGATIGGRIRDDNGEDVPNVTVEALALTYLNGYPELTTAVKAKTDYKGEYRLFWMKAGDYIIAAGRDERAELGARTFFPGSPDLKRATAVPLKVGENLEGADFTLSDAGLAKVSGEIINRLPPPVVASRIPGLPAPPNFMPPVWLWLTPRDVNTPHSTRNLLVATVSLESNRGTFEFTAPPGSYYLLAEMEGGGAVRRAIDVGEREFAGVTLDLQAPIPIKGAINANGATADLTGLRVEMSMDALSIRRTNQGTVFGRDIPPDGSFATTLPVEGRYRVDLFNLPAGTALFDLRQNGASVFDTGFTASVNTPVEVVLGSGTGVLRGVVQDANGKPLPNATVSIVPPDARRQNRSLYKTARTNGAGEYAVQGILPGDYKVFAWQAIPNGSFFNPTFLARYEDKGKPITVEARGTIDVNLKVADEP